MPKKKTATKSKKATAATAQASANGKGASKTKATASQLERNGSIQATDARMLRLWKKIYEEHHMVEKVDA
jgi:hypothetical protein